MKFEWDEEKRKANLQEHGIDFADAWEVFLGPLLTDLDRRMIMGRPACWA